MSILTCPACNTQVSSSTKNCPVCGAQIEGWTEEKDDLFSVTENFVKYSTAYKIFRIVRTSLLITLFTLAALSAIFVVIIQMFATLANGTFGDFIEILVFGLLYYAIPFGAIALLSVTTILYPVRLAEQIVLFTCIRKKDYNFKKTIARAFRPENFEGEVDHTVKAKAHMILYRSSPSTVISALFRTLVYSVCFPALGVILFLFQGCLPYFIQFTLPPTLMPIVISATAVGVLMFLANLIHKATCRNTIKKWQRKHLGLTD